MEMKNNVIVREVLFNTINEKILYGFINIKFSFQIMQN